MRTFNFNFKGAFEKMKLDTQPYDQEPVPKPYMIVTYYTAFTQYFSIKLFPPVL